MPLRALHPPVVIAAVALLGCGGSSDPRAGKTRPPPLVAVVPAATRDVPVEARAPVDLRPVAQADIVSKTLGYLDAVLVDRGDHVRRGQLLALVRPSDLPDQLAAARSALAQSQATLGLARSNNQRVQQLAPSGVVSQAELQQTTTALSAAEAQEKAVQSQIGALATRLGETRITSPLDGVVLQRRLDPGTLVGQPAGGVILTVAQLDVLRLFVAVGERYAVGIRPGLSAWLEVDALPGRRFTGKVVRVSPALDPVTRTLEAEVRIANTGELRPGMYGRAGIVIDTHPGAVVVPTEAVLISGDSRYVYELQGEIVHRRPVDTGVDGGTWMEIVRGLKGSEEVVVAGAEGLSQGAKVRVSRGVDPYTGAKVAQDGGSGGSGGAPAPAGGHGSAAPAAGKGG